MAHDSHQRAIRAAAALLGRRRFLTATGAAAALAFTTNLPSAQAASQVPSHSLTDNPFTLGVASGDALPDAVVLWTRLAPRPYEPGNGLPERGTLTVHYEIARDEHFKRIARRGTAVAHAEFNYTLHVDAKGLEPDRVYWYRFHAGKWTSPVGRTRTTPSAGARIREMRFGLASCQAYHDGYFTALGHLADEDLDAVFHVGDYHYEYAVNATGGARNYTDRRLPAVFNKETVTLEDYRLRYALYKSDEDLQAAHAAFPWYVTWDDHETENNYADDVDENDSPSEEFLVRRAAAYRAYWENMPLRMPQRPDGPDMRLYRRFHYGRLAQFDILDTRQYRSNQAYGDGWQYPGPDSEDPDRTLTGGAQERWLLDGFRRSRATWNVLPQQVTFSQRKNTTAARSKLSMDSWDGYPASRDRILAGVEQAGVENLVVLTGDVHVHYAFDIKENFDKPDSRTVGVEFVGTSLTSGKDGADKPDNWSTYMAANPHMKFYNGRRGYVTVTLDERQARADYKTVAKVSTPGAPLTTAASFVSEAGNPGLHSV
ncbi:alkaline phosphatase D family protein [Streptomyces sp. NEAU-Y11]|uniref:alkaline phosphatase D family protein n=1 Tax=Streptomyces cucumeris TaxID=2962890 RepID=UPI0020C86A72|nr:alkaline phosphatase D family protein [Streptomyces sp. NEAU-Y11]MCP9209772.1 alkaline phosphatase D family protein [Streptomyces sp. NEAU-Y11]